MSKLVLSVVLAATLFCTSTACFADCGCRAPAAGCCGAPSEGSCCDCKCCRKNTRLKLARVEKEVTRRERVCVVDECGRARMERVPVTKCVSRLELVRVPREPRRARCCESSCDCCPTSACGCGCN